jgi:glycosyltransferase involved in cell wall biosynthesis
MRRLLQIVPGHPVGGVERYALVIAEGAASEGWETHAAFPHTSETSELTAAFRDAGVTTHRLDNRSRGPSPWQVAVSAGRTARLLRRVKPAVAHVNLPLPTFARGHLIACALRRVPAVTVFHTAPDGFDVGRSRRLYPALRARAQAWVVVSAHDQEVIARSFGVPREEVNLIRNGVAPIPDRPPSREERLAVRRELGLPDSAFVALSVGRLSKQKAHEDVIQVAAAMVDRYPDLHFVIAGEGEERAALEALVREHRVDASVHLVGHRDDVDRLLRAADLFVLPSRFEGFPFALLEAAVRGVPIVAADVSGADEVVSHRHSGLLHPSGDIESFAGLLEFAVQNREEMRLMGRRAQENAGRFSREEMVRSTLSLLAAQAAAR